MYKNITIDGETIKIHILTGYIAVCNDEKYLAGIDTSRKHNFFNTGFWIAYGNREIKSYKLCDDNRETLPEFEHLQFSRDRHNRFYLETVN